MRKYYKFVAVILSCALMFQIFVAVGNPFNQPAAANTSQEDSENKRIAAEISNMTGIESGALLELRASGKSWNSILDELGHSNESLQQEGKASRNMLLLGSGLSEEDVKTLIDQGFEEQHIQEAKLLAERTAFQLQELLQGDRSVAENPLSQLQPKEDELLVFRKAAEQFNLIEAVTLMLQLQAEFGSFEAVLDEYLYALQLELNLGSYLQDKEAYLELKQQKSIENISEVIVSLSEIDRRLLETIQRENNRDNQDLTGVQNTDLLEQQQTSQEISVLPDMPLPTVEDKRPPNPLDEVMKELKALNPNAQHIE
jgi:hypothetical protein